MTDTIQVLTELILSAKKTVFFGGAGVSTESGVPDFRSAKGLYHQNRPISPETILSHSFFIREPAVFYDFYIHNLLYPDAKPNLAHIALAKLEQAGKLSCVVTQNIDGLHQAAGSKNVLELHGTSSRYYCMDCAKPYDNDLVLTSQGVPRCACGGLVRPDVVLYEEALDDKVTRQAVQHINACDLLIIGGTSLSVYPAASFAQICPGKTVIINRDPTPFDYKADLVIHDAIGQTLGAVLSRLTVDYDLF